MKINNTQNTQSLLQQIQQTQTDNLRKLASGKQVENAVDDAAAMQIIERLTSESQAYQRSLGNAYDGVSLLSVAEGGLANVQDDLHRIESLTLQAGNGALSDGDRRALQTEAEQLRSNIHQTLERTEFGGIPLLTQDEDRVFQVGSGADNTLTVGLKDIRQQGLESLNQLDFTDPDARANLLESLSALSEGIAEQRAEFGAQQNAFMSVARELTNTHIGTEASRSRMQDLDYAQGTAQSIQSQILQNAAVSVQGQANAQGALLLSFLS